MQEPWRYRVYRHLIRTTIVLAMLSHKCNTQVSDTTPVDPQDLSGNICTGLRSCGECIVLDPSCGWCADQGYAEETNYPRCDLLQNLQNRMCQDIIFPESTVTVEQNEPLRDAGDGPLEEAVQVAPQKLKLKLRPGETAQLSVSVRQSEDYPVDLYYVMDLSLSMKNDLASLNNLAKTLAQAMGNITRNLRLGFGSFVEKTVAPYVNVAPSSLLNPCKDDNEICRPTYNFRNHLPLNVNPDLFSQRVSETSVSGNQDHDEAGLDALMQVTVCKDQIGWQPRARHIVVYTSDQSFHFAGDGRLGGIVLPHDGQCHINPATGFNERANEYDYPSIGHLNFRMRQQNVIPIFAVVGKQLTLYEKLTEFITGSTVGFLAPDSSNVVDLITTNYAKITSRVEVVDNAPENLAVSYTSRCVDEEPNPGSRVCTGLLLGQNVSFDVSVEARSCPDTQQQSFSIRPIGFDEAVEITVEVICNCECEELSIPNSEYCTDGNGTMACGQCKCDPGRYGKLCECSSDDEDGSPFRDKYENVASCRANGNSTSSIACSGRGECICGECVCFERQNRNEVVSGRFCECDNFSCERYNTKLCGGPERGECVCDEKKLQSVCKCRPGYEGNACSCATSTENCLASTGLLCNGQGTCSCNKCTCQSPFTGPTCEVCNTCIGQCSSYQPCVECQAFGVDISPVDCSSCNVAVVVEATLPTLNDSSLCVFTGGNSNCSSTYNFVYETLDNGTILVHLEEARDCNTEDSGGPGTGNGDGSGGGGGGGDGPVVRREATPVEILGPVIGIVAAIVLIGVVVLALLKVATHLHDKREFARFQKDQASAVWDKTQNPIYKPSTSTYINPAYGKQ